MESLWNNAALFNDLSLTFSKLTFDTIAEYPADMHITYYTNDNDDEDGFLDEGVEKTIEFSKLSELVDYQIECNYNFKVYRIKDIILYKDASDKVGGLVLDERHDLGRKILNKYYAGAFPMSSDSCSDTSGSDGDTSGGDTSGGEWGVCSSSDCSRGSQPL